MSLGNVSLRIKQARVLAGKPAASSLSKVAHLAGGHVGLIESGEIETPDLKTLTKLASVLGVSVEWLLFGSGTEPRPRTVRRAWERALREFNATKKAA